MAVRDSLTLGSTEEGAIELDLGALIGSHMGIVANSGGGKSGLVRKLLEVTHGRIQHIVLDSEDEYYTLRERFDYVIAGGDEGDTPATVENAPQLALAALTHGFSLICQINDLTRSEQNEFIDAFLAAMIGAPRALWHPCLVVVDEAQRFDAEVLRRLTEAGRKRGFTAVLATQRLPKMDANIRGDLNNWIMGRVGQSLDRRNMADQLGMAPGEARALASIDPRHFYAFGPALAREPVQFRVGDVETTMVRPGEAKVHTPPPPEALRAILSGLAVEPVDKSGENSVPVAATALQQDSALIARIAELERERDEWAIERAVGQRQLDDLIGERDDLAARNADLHFVLANYQRGVRALHSCIGDGENPSVPRADGSATSDPLVVPPVEIAAPAADPVSPQRQEQPASTPRREPRPASPVLNGGTAGETALPAAAEKMIAMLDRIAPAKVTWASLAAMCGYKPRGGNFNAARKAMRESARAVGGSDDVTNKIAMHRGCNSAKNHRAPTGCELIWHAVVLSKMELHPVDLPPRVVETATLADAWPA